MCLPFISAYLVVWSVKQLRQPKTTVELPIPKKRKPGKLSAQERKAMDILANIDRYDGTSNGQNPIK